jgi:hypothetical protein
MAVAEGARLSHALTPPQRNYLKRALAQPGGKLPLFDSEGQPVDPRIVRSCLAKGWATPWFDNPLKADWLVCRITETGRRAVGGDAFVPVAVNEA